MKRRRANSQLNVSVAEEIESSISTYAKWSRIYEWSSAAIVLLSIFFSFIAGINTAHTFIASILCSAVIAGSPALLLSIERTLKLRARSEWFWNMVLEYQALQRAVEREELDDNQTSRRISELEEKSNKNSPKLSNPG